MVRTRDETDMMLIRFCWLFMKRDKRGGLKLRNRLAKQPPAINKNNTEES